MLIIIYHGLPEKSRKYYSRFFRFLVRVSALCYSYVSQNLAAKAGGS